MLWLEKCIDIFKPSHQYHGGMRQKEHQKAIRLSDWLLAETTRRAELESGQFELNDAATRAAVRLEEADVNTRIVERARRRDSNGELRKSIADALNGLRWAFGFLLLLGLLAGAGAAQTILTTDGLIRLSWAILTLLGVPTLMLMLWLAVTLWPKRRQSGRGLPGRAFWWLSSLFARRFSVHPAKRQLAASIAGYGRLHGSQLASLATHAFWSCFFTGALILLWAAFIGLRFDFSWGTTIIDSGAMEQVIVWLGQPAAWLTGLELPTQAQIMALLAERSTAADRNTWAWYLLSVLAVYGLLPRAVLAVAYAWIQRRIRPTLDLSAGGYLQLLPVLAGASSERIGPQGAAPPSLDDLSQSATPAIAGDGHAVMIGVELENQDWPPRLNEHVTEALSGPSHRLPEPLGRADHRSARNQLYDAIALLKPRPERIVALCSMVRTPDRGVARWLTQLNSLAPVQIVLLEHEILRKRGDDVGQRLADWQVLARRVELAEPMSPDATQA